MNPLSTCLDTFAAASKTKARGLSSTSVMA
jgi:hypothetical protein